MADVSYDVDQLLQMKRPQLQKLCKKLGIKANSKTSLLIKYLKEYKEMLLDQHNEKIKTPVSTPKVEPMKENVESLDIKANNATPKTTAAEGREKAQEESSFEKEMMEHLENKVKETLKESKIPRLNMKTVSFTIKTPTESTTKEHVAFKKMDSIDVYLEKKRKRAESFYQNAKKAKTTATTARSIVAEMKASHNTPARKTPDNKKPKGKAQDKSVTIATKPFAFGHLKSPKVSGFSFGSQNPKTPTSRKSFSVAIKAKENKTPHDTRKSINIAVTPFRFGGTETTTKCTSASAKKKFDLQASLSKPLRYKPHKGKLEEFKLSTMESKIPVRTNKASACNEKKVDVKNVKITSRAERREKEMNKRANRRKNAMFQRRGLVN